MKLDNNGQEFKIGDLILYISPEPNLTELGILMSLEPFKVRTLLYKKEKIILDEEIVGQQKNSRFNHIKIVMRKEEVEALLEGLLKRAMHKIEKLETPVNDLVLNKWKNVNLV